MKNRAQRLKAIIQIIDKVRIASQEELLEALLAKGYEPTQATLSRDLKYLKVGKVVDEDKGSVYVMPGQINTAPAPDLPFSPQGFRSVEFSNNLCVIKTIPGYASAIASFIDRVKLYEILGTIAGDDTILIIPREGINRQALIVSLQSRIPELQEIFNK